MARKKKDDIGQDPEYEKVPLLPGPGAVLREDGTWLQPGPQGGYLKRQRVHPDNVQTPAQLRRRMRGDLAEGMHVAVAILHDADAKHREKLAALEFLAKYGVGQRKDSFSPELVKALAMAVQAEVKDPEVLRRIEGRWSDVLKEHLTGELSE